MKDMQLSRHGAEARLRAMRLLPIVIMLTCCTNLRSATDEHLSPGIQKVLQSTVRIRCGSDFSSGVLVSPAGHVLTVAHGLHAETAAIAVVLHDGSQHTAIRKVVDRERDLAIVQLTDDGETRQPYIAISPAALETAVGDRVLASGWPAGGGVQESAQLRLGTIQSIRPESTRTDCLLSTGDSGGPLLNAAGQLIGVHRRIGAGNDANYHISLTSIQRWFREQKLLEPLLQEMIPESSLLVPVAPLSEESLDRIRVRLVRLRNEQQQPAGVGFLHNRSRLLTPAGQTASAAMIGAGSKLSLRVTAEQTLRDQNLQWYTVNSTVDDLPQIPSATACRGQIVYAVSLSSGSDEIAVRGPGIISAVNHAEPSARVFLGLRVSRESSGVVVTEVIPNGPAQAAGLQVSDQLQTIGLSEIEDLDAMRVALEESEPGDAIRLTVQRGGQVKQLTIQADHDPADLFDRRIHLDGRAGPLSQRRTGLTGMICHDIPVLPEECGGVLVTPSGEILGLNISRVARQCTLAAPLP